MVIRDLFVTSPAGGRPSINVRRPQTVVDHSPAATALGRFDQWFNRMVIECGLGFSPVTALLLIVFSGMLAAGATLVVTNNPLATTAAAVFLMFLTLVWFQIRRVRRMTEIQNQLPDVIDLMARAVHAGENLEQAIALVGDEMSDPLGAEFRWCSQQLDLGRTVSATMHSLTGRIRLIDMRLLATVLAVHRKTGGNLAMTLERLSVVSRDRLNYMGQMRATTGSGRISARMIAAAGPLLFLFLYFTQTDYMQRFFNDPFGRLLFATGVVLEIVGLIWIARLTKVSY
jgi:tight adherence protein B